MNKNNKKLVVETTFIKATKKYKLSLEEFLVLLYFDNSFDLRFDLDVIKNVLALDDATILQAYTNLINKKLIKVTPEKNKDGKIEETINLENFYNEILYDEAKENKKEKCEDIFSVFEREFGRPLSSMDYEIINAWMEKGMSEELIIGALKEAIYNGVTNLRYIDKILFEWLRKGFKNMSDVRNHLKTKEEDTTLYETSILNFNWLDNNE